MSAEIRLTEFSKFWVDSNPDGTITIGIDGDFNNTSAKLTPEQADELVNEIFLARIEVRL
jgi:hypothetical protein